MGGFPGQARVFRHHFGQPPRPRQPQGPPTPEQQQRAALLGFAQLLPVLLLLVFALFGNSGEPPFALYKDSKYSQPIQTVRLEVRRPGGRGGRTLGGLRSTRFRLL
jgi:hypothetical protein